MELKQGGMTVSEYAA
ncbi:hypothetical protein A2U01_0097445, partial [Trifolium medium]|nr:hypothetical protein [Trifolium medium]